MTERELGRVVKECTKHYYEEDKKIMLDESLMRIKDIIFYIFDLVFFGNQIIIDSEVLKKIRWSKNRITYKVYADNCSKLIRAIEGDKHSNYVIVSIDQYGNSPFSKIEGYLKENDDLIYLVSNKRLYNFLVKKGLKERVKLIEPNFKVTTNIHNSETIKFATINRVERKKGILTFNNQYEKDAKLIRIFDCDGKEKKGETVEVEFGDIILIRTNKNIKYTFNLYRVTSRHSRNFAIHVIWTDLIKGENSNFYIRKQDEKYRNIIAKYS